METSYNENSNNQLNLMFKNKDIIISLIQNSINDIYNDKTFKILDIGSSHGRNSLIFIEHILSHIITKLPNKQVIEIYHCDLEINDFTKLFLEINNNNISYKNKYNNTFSYAIGNSFLNQLLPNNSCNIIFSFFTFHWCDFNEGDYFKNKNSFINIKEESRPKGVVEFNKKRFSIIFKHRSNELLKGGIFICNVPIDDNNSSHQIELAFTNIKTILKEMAYESILSLEEVEEMTVPMTSCKKEELEYAIRSAEESGLKLIHCENNISNWKLNVPNNKHYIQSLLVFISPFIKNVIKDKTQVNLIYSEFNKRLEEQNELYPQKFDFCIVNELLIFRKE